MFTLELDKDSPRFETFATVPLLRLGTLKISGEVSPSHKDLGVLGSPQTGNIGDGFDKDYEDVFVEFNRRYPKERNSSAVRFGCYRLVFDTDEVAHVYFGPSVMDVPSLVKEDYSSIKTKLDEKIFILSRLTPIVMAVLEDNGYLPYLKHKNLLKPDSTHTVEITLDFYPDRAGVIGFHKDSLDHTIFVGLFFNNSNIINGPEYHYDISPDETHLNNLKARIPDSVLGDIATFRGTTAKGFVNKIYRSQLNRHGWIMFADETINHSSPTLTSRAISGPGEKEALLKGLAAFLPKDECESISKYFGTFDDTEKFYPEDIMDVVSICRGVKLTDIETDTKIVGVFVNEPLNKANFSIVQINNCEPTKRRTNEPIVNTRRTTLCRDDLHPTPSRTSNHRPLVRENSDRDLTGGVRSAPSEPVRQFVRLWVQVIPA